MSRPKPSERLRGDANINAKVPVRASSDEEHEPVFFVRTDGSIPAREFLARVPSKVATLMRAVIVQVALAPPKRFAGGGYWEAMHGDMRGWFEVRVDGPMKQIHYRLFCLLDYWAIDRDKPLLVLVTGLSKPVGSTFHRRDYTRVQSLGDEYFATNPRSII